MFSERKYNRFNYARGTNYVVPALIFLNIFVYLLQFITTRQTSALEFVTPVTDVLSLVSYAVVKNFQIWRIVSYMFVHADFWHLAINMWGLYLFGSMIEQRIGGLNFAKLYFISGFVGALFWIGFHWGSQIPCVGASGALFGVMVAAAMMYPNVMIMLLIPPIPLKLKTFVIIYALIETFFSVGDFGGNVAHLVHLGGLLGGYFYMRVALPQETFDVFKFLKNIFLKSRKNKHVTDYSNVTKKWTFIQDSASRLDTILDKISKTGINSLTEEELEFLKRAREEMKKR